MQRRSVRKSGSFICAAMQVMESKKEQGEKRKFIELLLSIGPSLCQPLKPGSPGL